MCLMVLEVKMSFYTNYAIDEERLQNIAIHKYQNDPYFRTMANLKLDYINKTLKVDIK